MPLKATKGAKRVRLLGVGYENPQITVTFTLKETGDVVGIHQLIFGGKTNRCQPQSPVPANTYYDHTMSHWQTPATYITYLEKVVIPDRKATIERLNLLQNQWAFVVHDLHYTVANKPFKVGIKAAFRDYLCDDRGITLTAYASPEVD